MLNSEETTTQKRKASPSPTPEDAGPKRAKLEEKDGDAVAGNGDGVAPERKEAMNGNSSAVERHDEISDRRPSGADTADRLSAEARKPALPVGGRRNFSQEEKKRGQRLFGGLLSTLSQTTSNSQQKKRLEIERRQQAKAQLQRAEDDKRRLEKLDRLNHIRKIEQVKFDEQAVRSHSRLMTYQNSWLTIRRCTRDTRTCLRWREVYIPGVNQGSYVTRTNYQYRHDPTNMCFLKYYRPWELTKEQEHTIEGQIREAKETIDRETQEFKVCKEKRLKELGALRPPSRSENTVGEPKPPEVTNLRASASSSSKVHNDKDHDDKDELVHDEEDTVLY